jgi:hypothetical protein
MQYSLSWLGIGLFRILRERLSASRKELTVRFFNAPIQFCEGGFIVNSKNEPDREYHQEILTRDNCTPLVVWYRIPATAPV